MRGPRLQRPFEHLNLRWNPFGEVPVDERAALAVVDVEPMIARLRAGDVVELVGHSGRGKSTRLRVVAAQLPVAVYVHVLREAPPETLPEAEILCIDEAQFLPRRLRHAVFRRDAGLALGTHVSLADEARTAGRSVETVALGGALVDASFLRAAFERRIEWARRGEGEVPAIDASALEWLLATYGDNIRAMEHHLYEVFQALQTVRRVVDSDLEEARAPAPSIVRPRPVAEYVPD